MSPNEKNQLGIGLIKNFDMICSKITYYLY